MKVWYQCGIGLALLAGLTPGVRAQIGAPAAPAGAAAPAAGAAPAAPPNNIWTKLFPTAEQKEACREKLCKIPLVQLLSNTLKPAGALTGGIIPSLCPDVTMEDLAKPPDSAEGAAARAKADAADAKKRREAIRYLSTLDCTHWPEAQAAMVASLRQDKNECVRLEAAYALGRGCCCTKETIMALVKTVAGVKDNDPAECSERVKAMARASLEHCLACFTEVVPAEEKTDGQKEGTEKSKEGTGQQGSLGTYPGQPLTDQQVIAEARRVLEKTAYSPAHVNSQPVGHSLIEVMQNASNPTPPTETVIAGSDKIVAIPATVEPPSAGRRSLFDVLKKSPSAPTSPEWTPAPLEKVVVPPPMTRPAQQSKASTPPVVQVAAQTNPTWTSMTVSQPATAPGKVVSVAAAAAMPTKPVADPMPGKPVPVPVLTRPTTPAPAPVMDVKVPEMLETLRTSPYPDEREWAVNALATPSVIGNTQVYRTVVTAATEDTSPTVRLACVRFMVKLKLRSTEAQTALHKLQNDSYPTVRVEAEQALHQLQATP
jgi:hypothetical protein